MLDKTLCFFQSFSLLRKLSFFGGILLFSLSSPLLAGSITLINDSVFTLTARIYNAQGTLSGTVPLHAGQSYIWYGNEDSAFSDTMNAPYTPYTVRWMCANSRPYDYSVPKKKQDRNKTPEYSSEFGSWNSVPTGSTLTALGSPNGSKTCVVKKKQQTGRHSYTPSSKKSQTEGSNAWSNDGGQTWTSDSGHNQKNIERDEFDNDGGEDWSNDAGPGWNNTRRAPSQNEKNTERDEFQNDGGENWTNDE